MYPVIEVSNKTVCVAYALTDFHEIACTSFTTEVFMVANRSIVSKHAAGTAIAANVYQVCKSGLIQMRDCK